MNADFVRYSFVLAPFDGAARLRVQYPGVTWCVRGRQDPCQASLLKNFLCFKTRRNTSYFFYRISLL